MKLVGSRIVNTSWLKLSKALRMTAILQKTASTVHLGRDTGSIRGIGASPGRACAGEDPNRWSPKCRGHVEWACVVRNQHVNWSDHGGGKQNPPDGV